MDNLPSTAKENNIDYKNLFSTIIGYSNNILIFLSNDLKIVELNYQAESLYNCKFCHIANKDFLKISSSKKISSTITKKLLNKVLLGESFYNILNIININSVTKYIVWNIFPLKNYSNSKNGILLIGEDITRLKETEMLEKTIRGHLENIITHIPGYIFWKDKNSRIMGCNENFAKIAGQDSKSIIGKNDFDLPWKRSESIKFRKDDREVIRSGIAKLNIEEPMQQIDGSKKFLLTNKVPLRDAKNNIIGVIGIFSDITDRKKAELELIKAKENTEIAHRATRIFAESISHELHTPLASLSGYIYGIKKYLPNLLAGYQLAKKNNLPVPHFRKNHYNSMINILDSIETEIKHANAIIDMTLFRINPNKLTKASLTMCSIHEIIKQTLKLYPFKNDHEKLLINWICKNNFLFLGETLFSIHILFNLLKNALYYITEMQKGEIYIWTELGKNYNKLYFKDTSKGIAPNTISHIFDLYYSHTPHGTGVGLAFCKQVMQTFSGDIECRSKEGVYTEFILKFPILKRKKIH